MLTIPHNKDHQHGLEGEKIMDNAIKSLSDFITHCWERHGCRFFIIGFFVAIVMAVLSYFRAVQKGQLVPGWDTFFSRFFISMGSGLLGFIAALVFAPDNPVTGNVDTEVIALWIALSALFADRVLDAWEAWVAGKIEKLTNSRLMDK